MKRSLVLLLALPWCLGATAQMRSICADPYPPPATAQPDRATLTVDGAAAGVCRIETIASGKRPMCDFDTPRAEGLHTLNMTVCLGTDCSTATTKRFRTTLTGCRKPNSQTSAIVCDLTFGPDPPEPFPAVVCGLPRVPTQYIVSANGTSPTRQAFSATQNAVGTWTRSSISTGNATVGAVCDCAAIEILQFGARFCKVDAPGATQPMVAGCTAKK